MLCPDEQKIYELVFDGVSPSSSLLEHMEDCARCRKLWQDYDALGQRIGKLIAPAQQEPSVAEQESGPGRIGNFLILDKIGDGGMGIVYKAADTESGRMVALKIIRPSIMVEEAARKRFKAEVGVIARLDHPNIVRFAAQGEDKQFLWYAMDYIRGRSLAAVLEEQGALAVEEALRIMQQVAAGLANAHQNHIVHRDLKPENILIADDGSVKLVDFGVAKILDAQTCLTMTGLVVGTVSYMSPEQINGVATTPASDVFSFGIVMYQLLAGRLPFAGATSTDLMYKIAKEPHEPLKCVGEEIPESLRQLINHCLEKSPDRRYPDGLALAAALARVANRQPLAVMEPRRIRSRRRLGVFALLGLGLIGAVFFGVYPKHRTATGRSTPATEEAVPNLVPPVDEADEYGEPRDLIALYEAGAWQDLLRKGRWQKTDEGYAIIGQPGGGPDFAWSYKLPDGTRAAELTMEFKLFPAGAIKLDSGEHPHVLSGHGMSLAWKWHTGISVGNLDQSSSDREVRPPQLLSQEVWHRLTVIWDGSTITGRLNDDDWIVWTGEHDLTHITLAGDEFLDFFIRSLQLRLVTSSE